jgi:hypothetical protein
VADDGWRECEGGDEVEGVWERVWMGYTIREYKRVSRVDGQCCRAGGDCRKGSKGRGLVGVQDGGIGRLR